MACAMMRPSTSVDPPGASGTIMMIGCDRIGLGARRRGGAEARTCRGDGRSENRFADHDRFSPVAFRNFVDLPYARGNSGAKGQSQRCGTMAAELPRRLNHGSVYSPSTFDSQPRDALSPHRECRPPACRPACRHHRGGAAGGERRRHGRGADRAGCADAPASQPARSIATFPARPIWSRRCLPKFPNAKSRRCAVPPMSRRGRCRRCRRRS